MPDQILPHPTDKLTCAMRYVERGWKIFVLGAGRTPLPNCSTCRDAGARHDPEECSCLTCHGFYAATSDRLRLAAMVDLYPDGQLAVRCGAASGIVVIDAEGDSDGDMPTGVEVLDGWATWVSPDWEPPATLTATTPSGGVHLYYAYATGIRSRNRVLPSVDVKSDGGYVVLPCGDNGRTWRTEGDPVEMPGPLVDWLRSARGRTGGGTGTTGHGTGYDYATFVRDGCPGGHRDEFFNDMCFRLRRTGVAQVDAESELRHHWERAAQPPAARWYMPWDHVLYKLHRVWQTVDEDDPVPDWRGDTPAAQPPDIGDGTAVRVAGTEVREPAVVEGPTDLGNAERFVRLYGDRVRYVTKMKRWLVWDGHRWAADRTNEVAHLATTIGDDVRRRAEAVQDHDEQQRWVRHALNSDSYRAVGATVALAATHRAVAVDVSQLDRDPELLVVRNGVLDLRTATLRNSHRDDLCTRSASVAYEATATCPRWRDHIKFITQGDVLLAAYLRRAVGYTLTGLVNEQVFFMLEGMGDNGKNAFIEPLVSLLGDYAQTGTSALLTGGDEQHPTILADLVGARMVFVDEARQGRPLNVERVKQLTGSKRIKARWTGQNFFEFDATLKLWIAGNNHPTMRDPSDGVWRRLHRVLFHAKVPAGKKIKDYGDLLFREEAPGILNWALEGLRDWRQLNGLGEPDSVIGATTEVRAEEDVVGQWIEERCLLGPAGEESNTALYTDFCIWSTLAGIPQRDRPTRAQFGRQLATKGLERWTKRVDGTVTRGYRGITISVKH